MSKTQKTPNKLKKNDFCLAAIVETVMIWEVLEHV